MRSRKRSASIKSAIPIGRSASKYGELWAIIQGMETIRLVDVYVATLIMCVMILLVVLDWGLCLVFAVELRLIWFEWMD